MSKESVKTFSYQDKLPRLPIPTLESSLNLFKLSIQPYLNNLSRPDQSHLLSLIEDFQSNHSLGPVLQNRLIQHDKNESNSWLERWWLESAYLKYRDPVTVNVNWYCLAKDEDKELIDRINSGDKKILKDKEFTKFQIRRASNLVNGYLDFKHKVENQQFPLEFNGKTPLCMNQYKNMFGVVRIPHLDCDKLKLTYPSQSRHIIVMCLDHLFKVPVYEPFTGKRLKDNDIEKLLIQVVELANKLPEAKQIGILTAGHRDNWANAYTYLQKLSSVNSTSFQIIQESLFCLSLDSNPIKNDLQFKHKNIYYGNNGSNRWFDFAISLIVEPNGSAGLNGEHSPLDGHIPAIILHSRISKGMELDNTNSGRELGKVELLDFVIDDKIDEFIKNTKLQVNKVIKDSDSFILSYKEYGVDFIKNQAKTSPDGYLQMAIQLAYYLLHQSNVSTYETGSTRKFLHGRTDAIRTHSEFSEIFCRNMTDLNVSDTIRYQSLQNAIKHHTIYTTQVSQGLGCDRHFLGLKLCLKPDESLPLFEHNIFKLSSKWTLSTSSMFKTDLIEGTGFGSVDPKGYGISYIPSANGNRIQFGIESKCSYTETNSYQFSKSIIKAMDLMKQLIIRVNNGIKYQPKL